MHIEHSPEIWAAHPGLVAAVVHADGITGKAPRVERLLARYTAVARERLASGPESELPEIRAWRRAFARMDLRPTQYRCASEALLRRLRQGGSLPAVHPLVDLCNAISVAFAIPVAALDTSQIAQWIQVRPAVGDEEYLTFGGEVERPDPDEVIFVDAARHAHARRWTNRQSSRSAVRESTTEVLIVAEALHETASADVPALAQALVGALEEVWSTNAVSAILSRDAPRFDSPVSQGSSGSGWSTR
jgi:DNA/RNA-binding domain of Phe-tRNA-synthetase-like protein